MSDVLVPILWIAITLVLGPKMWNDAELVYIWLLLFALPSAIYLFRAARFTYEEVTTARQRRRDRRDGRDGQGGYRGQRRAGMHVDHILPLARAPRRGECSRYLNASLNLKHVTPADNLAKSDALPPREQVSPVVLRNLRGNLVPYVGVTIAPRRDYVDLAFDEETLEGIVAEFSAVRIERLLDRYRRCYRNDNLDFSAIERAIRRRAATSAGRLDD